MRILIVHNSYRQAGGEDVVFRQEANLLRAGGHTVETYVRCNSELEDSSIRQKLKVARDTIWSATTREHCRNLLRSMKPDVVHVHNTLAAISPSIFAACQDAGIPAVKTLHNYRLLCPSATFYRDGAICHECVEHGLWRSVYHGCYRESRAATAVVAAMLGVNRARRTWTDRVDKYIALTEYARSTFTSAGLPADKIVIKPNCVHPDPGERESDGEFVLFAGRLCTEKGVDTLLAAWKQLPRSIPLRIAGEGPLRHLVERAAADLPNLKFVGGLNRPDLFQLMKRSRLFALPTRACEMLPMTIVEAYACGVPVLGPKADPITELVAEGETGLLFDSGNAADLAAKVSRAWDNRQGLRDMGRRTRLEYETKYTAEITYNSLMRIYQDVIAARVDQHRSAAASANDFAA